MPRNRDGYAGYCTRYFTMQRKSIPLWVLIGGGALTMVAGCVNAVGFLSVHRQALCHMSGIMTALGLVAVLAPYVAGDRAGMIVGGLLALAWPKWTAMIRSPWRRCCAACPWPRAGLRP